MRCFRRQINHSPSLINAHALIDKTTANFPGQNTSEFFWLTNINRNYKWPIFLHSFYVKLCKWQEISTLLNNITQDLQSGFDDLFYRDNISIHLIHIYTARKSISSGNNGPTNCFHSSHEHSPWSHHLHLQVASSWLQSRTCSGIRFECNDVSEIYLNSGNWISLNHKSNNAISKCTVGRLMYR